jgi:hypothetical protein
MRRIFLFFPLFLFISATAYAFDISGLQPLAPYGVFSTFSAESLQKNKSSFEIGAERSREPDFYRFIMKTAYGLSDNLEFNLTLPYVYKFSANRSGIEDIAAGFKHRFYDEEKYGPSLAYIISASIGTGKDDISSDGRIGAGFIMSKRVGPFDGHINLFYYKPGSSRVGDEISASGGVEFAAAHNFKILSEIIFKKSHFRDEYDLIELRFGYRVKTTEFIYTTFGAGLDIKNRNPEYRFFVSVNFTTPEEKRRIRKFIEEE